MTIEGAFLWEGSEAFKSASNVSRFMAFLRHERGLDFADYEALRAWSADAIEAFWAAVWDHFGVISEAPYERVLDARTMPGARWFPGARVNFAEHVLRHEATAPDKVVFHHLSELRPLRGTTWAELGAAVRSVADGLRRLGVGPGDRVVAYMPNVVETMVAMLATSAIGAVWSSAAPEFGTKTVTDRFTQIAPKVLFAADGYRFAGKDFVRAAEIEAIVAALPSLGTVVWLDCLGSGSPDLATAAVVPWSDLASADVAREAFRYTRVASDHPLWILFSSGTTGLPKAIVHGHAGIIVEFYKNAAFHMNLKPQSTMFFYSTTGWMMWNTLVCCPMLGGAAVLYDGSPTHPQRDVLWSMAADLRVTTFGTSPAYIESMRKEGIVPSERHDLSAIENVLLIGSPSTPATYAWAYASIKADCWVTSQSGGTEVCGGIVGGSPLLPVHAGEIQCRVLGLDVRVFDEAGRELVDAVGEMVIAKPFPSMPLYLWGDTDFARYRASYFDMYPGVWRHGDFLRINARGGAFVYGRSDATLNRYGVRLGSSEIYMTLDEIDEVVDGLIVCVEEPDGGFHMPLFVTLRDGAVLDDALKRTIADRLRRERSPRHVPDAIVAVAAIPYTLTGKRMEVPVRRLLMGFPPETAYSPDTMRDPRAIDWVLEYARARANRGLFAAMSGAD